MNGEMGVIEYHDAERDRVLLACDDGRRLTLAVSELDTMRLAHAVSIHKAQGSQAPAVVVVLHRGHHLMLTRNLVYTAITRAERVCVVVGERAALHVALGRRDAHARHTRLQGAAGGLTGAAQVAPERDPERMQRTRRARASGGARAAAPRSAGRRGARHRDVAHLAVGELGDAVGQLDLQPLRRAGGQRRDDDLVVAAGVPLLLHGDDRVGVAQHARGLDAGRFEVRRGALQAALRPPRARRRPHGASIVTWIGPRSARWRSASSSSGESTVWLATTRTMRGEGHWRPSFGSDALCSEGTTQPGRMAPTVGPSPADTRWSRAALGLPQRDDHHLAGGAVVAADEDERAVDKVAHVDRAARAGRARRRLVVDAAGLPRARDPRDDLRPRVDLAGAPADALAEALDGVVGDGDQDAQRSRS